MTWNSQVSTWSAGTSASRLPMTSPPSGPTVTAAIVQWPTTTVASEATRSRSTYRSRPAGVAAARRAAGEASRR